MACRNPKLSNTPVVLIGKGSSVESQAIASRFGASSLEIDDLSRRALRTGREHRVRRPLHRVAHGVEIEPRVNGGSLGVLVVEALAYDRQARTGFRLPAAEAAPQIVNA